MPRGRANQFRRHAQIAARVWNASSNRVNCPVCRLVLGQYVWISPSMVDLISGRVAGASVQPGFFDWPGLGQWVIFLGPPEERRVPLCFQVVQNGLAGRTLQFRFTARCLDDPRVVAEHSMAWQVCHCPAATCRHNRLVRWLPPTNVWNQDRLVCDTELILENGELVFQGRMDIDISLAHLRSPPKIPRAPKSLQMS